MGKSTGWTELLLRSVQNLAATLPAYRKDSGRAPEGPPTRNVKVLLGGRVVVTDSYGKPLLFHVPFSDLGLTCLIWVWFGHRGLGLSLGACRPLMECFCDVNAIVP